MADMSDHQQIREVFRLAAIDPTLMRRRFDLAHLAAAVFCDVGSELDGAGRRDVSASDGQGGDEAVAIALLLRIASELVEGCAMLFGQGRHYAAAALLRQLAEVEYLAWAFETRDRDGERWLRSTREEREEFFRPARLRKASQGRFRSQDYSYHCELGGHPVPRAELLFGANADQTAQLLLSDALGHAGNIWNHLFTWANEHGHAKFFARHADDLPARHRALCADDPLCGLPPPP